MPLITRNDTAIKVTASMKGQALIRTLGPSLGSGGQSLEATSTLHPIDPVARHKTMALTALSVTDRSHRTTPTTNRAALRKRRTCSTKQVSNRVGLELSRTGLVAGPCPMMPYQSPSSKSLSRHLAPPP